MQGCNECGSTTHKSASSFACPEHKCTNCEGPLEPKGHNRNDCPRMQTTMCEECGETGHSANKCPIRPCNACGLRSHKLQTSICVLNTCALYVTAKNCQECQTCKLFGHVAKDCVYANCLDVDVDWFNLLFTKSESTVQPTEAYFAEVNGKWGEKYCAVELDIDHLYILPVSAPPIYAAASTSSTNTPTSTPTKQLNTRLTEINLIFD
jgi:hypothetical protein